MEISGISVAKEGLKNANQKLAQSAENIAGGDNSPSVIIDFIKQSENVELQTKNLSLQLEANRSVLDIVI